MQKGRPQVQVPMCFHFQKLGFGPCDLQELGTLVDLLARLGNMGLARANCVILGQGLSLSFGKNTQIQAGYSPGIGEENVAFGGQGLVQSHPKGAFPYLQGL